MEAGLAAFDGGFEDGLVASLVDAAFEAGFAALDAGLACMKNEPTSLIRY